jgi:hypothetical protein
MGKNGVKMAMTRNSGKKFSLAKIPGVMYD